MADERFDLDLLDDEDPFEIDAQAAHLFKHPRLGIEDIRDVWASDPMFYPAKPPAHWLTVAEVQGTVLMVPFAPAPATATQNAAGPSAATPPPNSSLTATGVTDEPAYDPRRGIRVLQPPRKPGAPRARATPAHRRRPRALPTPNCWSKYALRPPQTIALSRPGFAAQSSTSFAIPPERRHGHRSEGSSVGSRRWMPGGP